MAGLDKASISERLSKHDSTGTKYARKNRTYSRYFEGYTEYVKTDINGHKKIVREYTGDWYTCIEPKSRRRVRKLLYVLSSLTAFTLFVFLSVQPYAYNYSYRISLIQIAGTFTGLWNVLSVFRFVSSKEKMIVYEYKNIPPWVRNSSLSVCVCYCLMALAALCAVITAGDMGAVRAVMTVGGYVFSAVLTAGVYFEERKSKYQAVPNDKKATADGYTIEN